jgi:hypothetical protein
MKNLSNDGPIILTTVVGEDADVDQLFAEDQDGEPGEESQAGDDDSQGTDQQTGGEEYEALVSRYRDAGIDLEAEDPVTIARGISRGATQGQPDRSEDDIAGILDTGIRRLMASPDGLRYLQQLGLSPAQQRRAAAAADDQDDDPANTRIAQLEQMVSRLAQGYQGLQGDRNAILTERRAETLATQLDSHFRQALTKVPGATDEDFLEEDFWRSVGAGEIGEDLASQQGVRAWVKQYCDRRAKSRSRKRSARSKRTPSPRRADASSAAVPKGKKLDELTADDVLNHLESQLPE